MLSQPENTGKSGAALDARQAISACQPAAVRRDWPRSRYAALLTVVIAAEIFLSDKTVKNYVSSILSKLNLQRRTQAAAFVAKRHIGEPPAGT